MVAMKHWQYITQRRVVCRCLTWYFSFPWAPFGLCRLVEGDQVCGWLQVTCRLLHPVWLIGLLLGTQTYSCSNSVPTSPLTTGPITQAELDLRKNKLCFFCLVLLFVIGLHLGLSLWTATTKKRVEQESTVDVVQTCKSGNGITYIRVLFFPLYCGWCYYLTQLLVTLHSYSLAYNLLLGRPHHLPRPHPPPPSLKCRECTPCTEHSTEGSTRECGSQPHVGPRRSLIRASSPSAVACSIRSRHTQISMSG